MIIIKLKNGFNEIFTDIFANEKYGVISHCTSIVAKENINSIITFLESGKSLDLIWLELRDKIKNDKKKYHKGLELKACTVAYTFCDCRIIHNLKAWNLTVKYLYDLGISLE